MSVQYAQNVAQLAKDQSMLKRSRLSLQQSSQSLAREKTQLKRESDLLAKKQIELKQALESLDKKQIEFKRASESLDKKQTEFKLDTETLTCDRKALEEERKVVDALMCELKEVDLKEVALKEVGREGAQCSAKNLWFISDCGMDKKIAAQLSTQYHNIQEFDADTFSNISPANLMSEHNVQHMWTNIRNEKARAYVQKFVKPNKSYTTILIHRSTTNAKHQKWVHDLMSVDGAINIKMRKKDISSLNSLTVSGLIGQLDDQIVLHAPAGLLGMMTSLTSAVLKKKERS
jgi:hypothetical protein